MPTRDGSIRHKYHWPRPGIDRGTVVGIHGMKGFDPNFTPSASARGKVAAIPSVICFRDSTRDCPGTAPHTRTTSGAPIAAASSIARLLSSIASPQDVSFQGRIESTTAQGNSFKPADRIRSPAFEDLPCLQPLSPNRDS